MHTNKISWKNKYPLTTRVSIIETLHGREIGDPYRWLEDPNSEETLAWGEKQNKLTKEFLDSYPKQQLLEDLKKVWNFPKLTSPVKKAVFMSIQSI